jgi:hypothetical protein
MFVILVSSYFIVTISWWAAKANDEARSHAHKLQSRQTQLRQSLTGLRDDEGNSNVKITAELVALRREVDALRREVRDRVEGPSSPTPLNFGRVEDHDEPARREDCEQLLGQLVQELKYNDPPVRILGFEVTTRFFFSAIGVAASGLISGLNKLVEMHSGGS